jgi:hypothetical protein
MGIFSFGELAASREVAQKARFDIFRYFNHRAQSRNPPSTTRKQTGGRIPSQQSRDPSPINKKNGSLKESVGGF